MKSNALTVEPLDNMIYTVRGHKVMLDADLARIYGVETKALNRAVKRNNARFPEDFIFRLSREEYDVLRCQFGTSNTLMPAGTIKGRGGRRHLPFVFTEHGAFMAASVLSSRRAVRMSVFVVRAFVRLRQSLSTHKELAGHLKELERRLATHDHQIQSIIDTIRHLMDSPVPPPRRPLGFRKDDE